MKKIINTLGTSLLTNLKYNRTAPTLNPTDEDLLRALNEDPIKASAEMNAISRVAEPGDQLVLLYSATDDGERCSKALETHLREQKFQVERKRIEGLTDKENSLPAGLKNLVRLMAEEIQVTQRQGHQVIINATGGFKAQIAYATAVGILFKVEVQYIHEKFNSMMVIPPLPLNWDVQHLQHHQDFFAWLDAEPRPIGEAHSRLQSLPEELHVLVEEMDGHLFLSAMGEAFWTFFKGQQEEAAKTEIWLSPNARRFWDKQTDQAELTHLLQRLRQPNREQQSEIKTGGSDARGFPKGRSDLRLFYSEQEGKLYVFELCRHDRTYDDLCNTKLLWKDYPRVAFTHLRLS